MAKHMPHFNKPRQGGEFQLAKITTTPRKSPSRTILHAKPCWGKTSFFAKLPNAVFIMFRDDGLLTLMNSGQLPPTIPHWPTVVHDTHELFLCLGELITQQHSYKHVVIDGVSWVDQAMQEKVCAEKYDGEWGDKGFGGFDRGPKIAANEWDEMIDWFEKLRNHDIGVNLIAHSQVVNFKNPEGPDYERWAPAISKYSWGKLMAWADMVLFGNFEIFVDTKKAKDTKGKATGGQQRILCTEHHAAYDAKNRHGLPAEIDCGSSATEAWANFTKALREAKPKPNNAKPETPQPAVA